MEYLHFKNIYHSDLKLENIFVFGKKLFKIGDLGLCKKIEIGKFQINKDGTFNYMSPEIISDK